MPQNTRTVVGQIVERIILYKIVEIQTEVYCVYNKLLSFFSSRLPIYLT